MGHFARNCAKPRDQDQRPRREEKQKRKTSDAKPQGSFSAHLEKWCGSVKSGVNDNKEKEVVTEAYGKPFTCKVNMLGMTVDAMIDTGSVVSIVPLGLLLEAKKNRVDLDSLVTMMGNGNSQKVVDASGNAMRFLMLIATEVDVQGAGRARVQQAGDQEQKNISGGIIRAAHRHVIPPGGISSVPVSGDTNEEECIFWSENDRIASGVLKKEFDGAPKSIEIGNVVAVVADQDWLVELRKDENFGSVIEAIEEQREEEVTLARYGRKLTSADFEISNGKLRLIREDGSKVNVIPESKRRELFEEAHHGLMGGHFGSRKMLLQLEKIAFWPGMKQDIAKWCRGMPNVLCQQQP
ncbi:hypothetical protein COOONC_04799 [Cooperia oncophora]